MIFQSVATIKMGKKKKNRDIWDLTPEEQNKKMDDLYAIENGEFSILDLAKKKKGINSNGFSHGLESEIAKDLLGRQERVVSLDSDDSYHEYRKEYVEKHEKVKEQKSKPICIDEPTDPEIILPIDNLTQTKPVPQASTNNTPSVQARQISFKILDKLHRAVFDDGIVPTSFSFDIALSQELVASYDVNEAAEMATDLLLYAISLKHPTAVYELDDFLNRDYWKFASVKDGQIDMTRYKFYRTDSHVFCYLIEKDSVETFYNYMDYQQYNPNDVLRTLVSLAYAVGTLHQAFFVEEETYIKSFMDSELNNQKEFHKVFTNDLNINFVPNNVELTETDGIPMYNIKDMQTYVRQMISKITGTSYDDDDDEWDDEYDDQYDEQDGDYDDVYDEPEEYIEESDTEVEETVEVDSDLLSDEMEEVVESSEKKIDVMKTTDDDDEFIIDVVRKK